MRRRGDTTLERERQVIERQVTHLTRLVDDLLDVSRIARGKVDLKIETIDLAEILDRAVETASPLLEERSHALDVDVPRGTLVVRGDSARLTQVFSNLLTNAAKYTPAGGRIDVCAAADARDAIVRITDSGVGIDETMLPRIFDAFAQGPQLLDRAQGGLGLGLAIARSLTERHGGSITARSEGLGAGSEFVVRLPLSAAGMAASAPAAPSMESAAPHGAGRRVLIVDDNRDAAEMMATALTLRGFDVRTAHDGLTALDMAAAFGPEMAILDIGLPVMDGYELAARLRQTPGLERVRLIAVTGYGQKSDRERSAAAGFDQHIVKPVDVDRVIALALNV
jgi:CheY-like chemotaxis protein/two-component sensor histidine kinase